jgi:hypothetical protein
MLVRLLIVASAVVLASLLLRLHRHLEAAPPWLRMLHHAIFYVAFAYAVIFTAVFTALHLFGYRL